LARFKITQRALVLALGGLGMVLAELLQRLLHLCDFALSFSLACSSLRLFAFRNGINSSPRLT
jgi:hypothetical protein